MDEGPNRELMTKLRPLERLLPVAKEEGEALVGEKDDDFDDYFDDDAFGNDFQFLFGKILFVEAKRYIPPTPPNGRIPELILF